jgi:carboxyl-terminal processing protease
VVIVVVAAITDVPLLSVHSVDVHGEEQAKERSTFQGDAYELLKVFTEVLSYFEVNYVEEVDVRKIVYGAIHGMLKAGDPHGSFMPPDVYKEMQGETEGQFGAPGLEITFRDDRLTVVTPIEDGPAYRAGIQAGDQITAVDGEPTQDMTLIDAVKKLRGPEGTTTTISIRRQGFMETQDFLLTRKFIQIKNVRWERLQDDIGYIKLGVFQKNTSEELKVALREFEARNMKALVLDLRNHSGGLLEQAIAVADMFLEKGKLMVYTEGRQPNQNMKGFSKHPPIYGDYPMVVLVNKGTASGAEIVAGALQDHERAILVGTQTFGRGSIQTIIPLSDGSGLRLTTARYITPKGRSIEGKGIKPDIVIEQPRLEQSNVGNLNTDIQLQRAVELLKAK